MIEALQVAGVILVLSLIISFGAAIFVSFFYYCPECGQFDKEGFEEAVQQISATDYDNPYQYRSLPVARERRCKGCGHSLSVAVH